MTKLTKLIAVAAIISTASFSAHAGEKEQVNFKYSPSAPAAQTYKTLHRQVKKLCKDELGAFEQYAGATCMAEYMDEIIRKIDKLQLTAYYKAKIEGGEIIRLAETKK